MIRRKLGCAILAVVVLASAIFGIMSIIPPHPSLRGEKDAPLIIDKVESDSSCPYLLKAIEDDSFRWENTESIYEKSRTSNSRLKSTKYVLCSKKEIFDFMHHNTMAIYDGERFDVGYKSKLPYTEMYFLKTVNSYNGLMCAHSDRPHPAIARIVIRRYLTGNIFSTKSHTLSGFWECDS